MDPETGESLSNVEKVLTRYNIALRDSTLEFRPLGDVIDEVAQRWTTLSNVEQSQITMALAGVRQREKLTTLLNNYSMALGFQKTESEAAGDALRKYGIYLDNIESATNRSKAAFEKFAMVSFSEKTQIDLANMGAGLLNFSAAIGGLGPILTATIALAIAFKGQFVANMFMGAVAGINTLLQGLTNLLVITPGVVAGMNGIAVSAQTSGAAIASSFGVVFAIISIGALAFNYFNSQTEKAADAVKRLETEVSDLDSSLAKAFQNRKLLGTIGEEFESLRENTKRTAIEEERFLELQNKIKDIMPEVSGDYNSQGDFVLKLGTSISKLNDEHEREIKNLQEKKRLTQEAEFGPKLSVYKDAVEKAKSAKEELDKIEFWKKTSPTGGPFGFNNEEGLAKARLGYAKSTDDLKNYSKELSSTWLVLSDDMKAAQTIILKNMGKYGDDLLAEFQRQEKLADEANQKLMDKKYQEHRGYYGPKEGIPFNPEETKKAYDDLMGILSSIPNQAKTINDAFKETGKITIEQAESLRGIFGEDYIQAITRTNDGYLLNVDGLHQLIMAKAGDAIATAKLLMVNDPLNDLLREQYELTVQYYKELESKQYLIESTVKEKKKAEEDLLKMTIEYLKQTANAKKDALQKELDEYKDMIDAKKDAIEKAAEAEKQHIQDQLEGYKHIIDAEIDLLDQKKKTNEYNDTIADKNKAISDIDAQLLALQFDNSEAAKAKRLKLEAEKVSKVKDLTKYQNDYSVNNQKEALQKEYKQYEDAMKGREKVIERNLKSQKEALDEQYKLFEKDMKAKIEGIETYLKETGSLTIEAMGLLSSKSEEFYNKLLEWNRRFGDGVQEEIIGRLKLALGLVAQLQADGTYGFGGGGTSRPGGGNAGGRPHVAYHTGGIVGEGIPRLKEQEQFAVLTRGEQINTPTQIANFMNKVLPTIASLGKGDGGVNIELNVNVAGNMDKDSVPSIKEAVFKAVNDALKDRGNRRNSFSYSL